MSTMKSVVLIKCIVLHIYTYTYKVELCDKEERIINFARSMKVFAILNLKNSRKTMGNSEI